MDYLNHLPETELNEPKLSKKYYFQNVHRIKFLELHL